MFRDCALLPRKDSQCPDPEAGDVADRRCGIKGVAGNLGCDGMYELGKAGLFRRGGTVLVCHAGDANLPRVPARDAEIHHDDCHVHIERPDRNVRKVVEKRFRHTGPIDPSWVTQDEHFATIGWSLFHRYSHHENVPQDQKDVGLM